jgi:hypothetical protein
MAFDKNLIQVQSELKDPSIRDEDLIKYANGSNASVPSFLALMEMNRRKQLSEGAKAFDASNQQSIKDKLANALTGAPTGQVNPTAAPTGIAMGTAPNQTNFMQAPAQPKPVEVGEITGAAGGLMSLPINHFKPSSYAGGGIVAFAEGDLVDEEKKLSSFPQERRPSPQNMSDASIMQALRGQEEERAPQPRATSGYQSVLESLPKYQGNTMPAPQELTREQIFENMKENRRLAGVSEDPYAEVNKRQAAIEARQKAGYENQGLDRLLAQLTAFSKADPAKGFGYAGAVSAEASMSLEQQQNALRDRQEQVQLDYQKNMAKEEDSRRRNDATGIQSALEAQKKDQAEYAKLLQKDQEIEGQRRNTAATIFNVMEDSRNQSEANANTAAAYKNTANHQSIMANKPTREEFLANLAKTDPDLFRLVQGQSKAGVLTLEEALKIVNADQSNIGATSDVKMKLAQELLDAQERYRKTGSLVDPNLPAAPAKDDRSFYQRMFGPSEPAPNTMPAAVQKALEKYSQK